MMPTVRVRQTPVLVREVVKLHGKLIPVLDPERGLPPRTDENRTLGAWSPSYTLRKNLWIY